MRLRSLFLPQLALFALLNVADLGLTRLLLGQGLSAVYEGNPVAAWLLGRHGWAGLALFKFATAALVAGAAVFVFARRPRLGVGVLAFGCVTLAGVVMYSTLLFGSTFFFADSVRASEAAAARRDQHLNGEILGVANFEAFKDRLAADVIAGRCGVPEALERMMATPKGRDAAWMKALRDMYRLESDRDCLAANFINHLMRAVKYAPELTDRAPEWLAAYESQYRTPGKPPWIAQGFYAPDSRTAVKAAPAAKPAPTPDT